MADGSRQRFDNFGGAPKAPNDRIRAILGESGSFQLGVLVFPTKHYLHIIATALFENASTHRYVTSDRGKANANHCCGPSAHWNIMYVLPKPLLCPVKDGRKGN